MFFVLYSTPLSVTWIAFLVINKIHVLHSYSLFYQSMSVLNFVFSGERVALIVRGKTSGAHEPGVMEQHADCILSDGSPVGFFGVGNQGSSGNAPSSFAGSSKKSANSSQSSGMTMTGIVYDLNGLQRNRPYYVDARIAQGYGLISTVLFVEVSTLQAKAFDLAWQEMTANPGSFHLLGWNCSTHASQAFRKAGILSGGIPGLDTPNNLYKQLCREKAGKVSSASGYVGFSKSGSGMLVTVESL